MLKWTFIFIIACVAVFVLQIAGIVTDNNFAFTPSLAFEKPWTFVTSMFLHANFTHILINMLVLFFLGLFLESRIGPVNFVMVFLLSGIFGSIGYMITASDPTIPAVGASGAIYGVLGALAVLVPFAMVYIWGILPMPMIGVAVLWGIMDFFGLFGPGDIAHGAHLGGLAVGLLYGFYLRTTVKRRYRKTLVRYYH
jgi:membrane associated rhomboid family serine protease